MTLFQPASRQQRKLRMALVGPSGSGKTYTALTLAQSLGQKIAVIDTERGSASVYADRFQFDTLQLTSFSPEKYLEGIQAADGYDVLIIDSLSHAWSGKDGILEFVDKVAARSGRGNSFGAWREATPQHNKLVDGILDAGPHVIVTMRSKTEYVQEKNERTGKTEVRKVGMQPVQRDGLEYELDIVADLDWSNTLVVSKTRCEALQGYVAKPAGSEFAQIVKGWLGSGAPATERPPVKKDEKPKVEEGDAALGADIASIASSLKPLRLDAEQARDLISRIVERPVDSIKDLTKAEGETLAGWTTEQFEQALDLQRSGGELFA